VQRNQKKRVGNRRKRKPGDRYDVDAFRRAITYGIDKADRLARKERDAQLIAAGKLPKDHRTPNRVRREDRLVPPWHPHQLRHTAATRLRKQHGIETVRVILGHSSIEVSELYAETDMEQGKRVMEASG
jgi:integrase